MSRPRRLDLDRLIMILGAFVVVLGGVAIWLATRGELPFQQEPADRRALRQLQEQFGPGIELRYVETGAGRGLCGYAGGGDLEHDVVFVSRPTRVMTNQDPLPEEFEATLNAVCPSLANDRRHAR